MNKFVLVLLSCFVLIKPAIAQEASADSVKKLMMQIGAGDMGLQVMNQMLPALKGVIPQAPDSFWQGFMAKVSADDLIDMTVPIYQKYLSQSEVDELIAFYKTPVGKKMIQVQPNIIQESMIAGQKWGQELAAQVMQEYQSQLGQ